MKIFEKRPLAIILCVMLGGFSFFADFSWQIKLSLASIALLSIGIIYIFDKLKFGRKPIIIIALIAFSVSLLLSALWSLSFYPHKYYGENVSVKAKIYDIDYSGPYSAKAICKTSEIEGKRDKHTFIIYLDKDVAKRMWKYDVVTFDANLCDFPARDDGFDGRTYYVSRGYSAQLENVTSLEIHGNDPDRFDAFFNTWQLRISNKLKLRSNYRTGSFLSALIVGNRDDLSGNVKMNFSRLGISHILALSGMHLAILSAAVNSILKRFGVKKNIRMSLLIALVTFYVALTGFSASVLRAGIMLIISSVLFLLSSKADSVTSLSIAVFIIVLFNPTSVFDLSLWLSSFATLGVIVFSEMERTTDKDASFLVKAWNRFKDASLVSVFAFCATFAFTAIRFNAFSVVSIFTTLIFAYAIQILIYGGLLLLILGGIIPFGKLIIAFSDMILWFAEEISSLKFVYVSMDFFLVKLLIILLSAFFFMFLILDIKNKRRAIIVILTLMISVFTVAEVSTVAARNNDGAVYTPSASGDFIVLKSNSEVSVIYSGRAVSTAGYTVLDRLTADKLTYVDTFVFAGYSHSLSDFSNIVIDGIKINRIMLPVPTTDEELGQAEGLSYLLSDYGTALEFYDPLRYVHLNEYRYRLFEKIDYTYGKSPKNAFEIVFDGERIAYISPCDFTSFSGSTKNLLYNFEHLIIGTPSGKSEYEFNTLLPNIEDIYFNDGVSLTNNAKTYYKNIGASTNLVKTPVKLFD